MRVLLSLLALMVGFALPLGQAPALDYPTRTVRVIIPYTPGGAPDVLLRMVTQALAEKWGQGVVVENRAGGNTLIATVAAAKAEPDGYTLLCAADQTFVLNPLLYASLPYSMKELDPIILMASIPHMLAVANKVPVANVKELIALAKAKPETLMYGSTGPGSIQRIVTEYFAQIAGVKLVHVAYRGAPETMTAVLAGEIDMTINGVSTWRRISAAASSRLSPSRRRSAPRWRPTFPPCRRRVCRATARRARSGCSGRPACRRKSARNSRRRGGGPLAPAGDEGARGAQLRGRETRPRRVQPVHRR